MTDVEALMRLSQGEDSRAPFQSAPHDLTDWQIHRLRSVHAHRTDYGHGRDDVTVLIYFFWREEDASKNFPPFECAIRETWLHCGLLKTVIVENTAHDCVAEFASKFPNVKIQIEPALIPGRIFTMSLDCIDRLPNRFETPYVLIVQNDGFPLRSGLDTFVGKYDFIGAPSVRDGRRALPMSIGFPCLNGGFSLRSRRFCLRVSKTWNHFWKYFISVDSRFFAEDTFCTFTAMLSPFFRCGLRFPNETEAFSFAYDALNGLVSLRFGLKPFGFHGPSSALRLLNIESGCSATNQVTILAYHFWSEDGYEAAFEKVAHAFEETWRMCGALKSVLVVNTIAPCVTEFASIHPNLTIQEEPRLVPGRIFTMSEDCNARLYTRFDTPYVLIIQNDGWPLRSGLEEFIGKWDFIGAPYVQDIWWKRLVARFLNFHPMNGGFSLRSRRCCEAVARLWNDKYHTMGDCHWSSEDLFVTQFLPRHEPSFNQSMRFPNVRAALRFSYEDIGPNHSRELPFGFHRLDTLTTLTTKVKGASLMQDVNTTRKKFQLDATSHLLSDKWK